MKVIISDICRAVLNAAEVSVEMWKNKEENFCYRHGKVTLEKFIQI